MPTKLKNEKGKMFAEKKHDRTKGSNGGKSKDIGEEEIRKAQGEVEEDAMDNCAAGDQTDR